MTVILVTKRTVLDQLGSDVDSMDPTSLAKLRASHDAHHRTLEVVQHELARLGIKPWVVEGADVNFAASPGDTVVCCGGDGTVLSASHRCGPGVRLMAINSDPERSKGRFCGSTVLDLVRLTFDSNFVFEIPRMSVSVDGEVINQRVLNEVLFSHSCPAAMTRCQIEGDLYRCSGVWVGTSAGSTGALKSAGAEVLRITDPTIQAVVREPFEPALSQKVKFYARRDSSSSRWSIKLVNKTNDATLYLDGPFLRVPVRFDQEIRCSQSPEPLEMIGHVR